MKEVPIVFVRSNQAAMVLLIALSVIFQQPWIILVVFAVEIAGLFYGVKGNLFVRIIRPFLGKASHSRTESAELQRFNNSIAVILLTLAVIAFGLGFYAAGYILAGIVALAAFAAICGYCIGCTIYYQYKRLRSR